MSWSSETEGLSFVPRSRHSGRRPTPTTSRRRRSSTAYRKLASFRGDAAFRTWLLAITWRKALDRRKSVGRWLRLTVTPTDSDADAANWIEQMPADQRTQEEGVAAAQLQRTLKRLIKTLPRKLRDALLLSGSGEYNYSQIGSILGIPVGTVKWRVSEARRVLKEKMAALGHAYDG